MYYLRTTLPIERQATLIFHSRKLPCRTFPHGTLHHQTYLQDTFPGPDTCLMDTSPTTQIPEGYHILHGPLLDQKYFQRTFAPPGKRPRDIS